METAWYSYDIAQTSKRGEDQRLKYRNPMNPTRRSANRQEACDWELWRPGAQNIQGSRALSGRN